MAYNDKYVNPQFVNVAKTNHYSRLCKTTIWPQPLCVWQYTYYRVKPSVCLYSVPDLLNGLLVFYIVVLCHFEQQKLIYNLILQLLYIW